MIAEKGGIEIQPLAHHNRESPKMVQKYVDDSKRQKPSDPDDNACNWC